MYRAFYIVAFALFLTFIAIFFFMPETAYYGPRPIIPAFSTTDSAAKTPTSTEPVDVSVDCSYSQNREKSTEKTAESSVNRSSSSEVEVLIPPKPYVQTLKFWSKDSINPEVSLKKAFLRPVVLCA